MQNSKIKFNYILLIFSFLTITFVSTAFGLTENLFVYCEQQSYQTINKVNKHQRKLTDYVKITVSSNSSELVKENPFLITVTIENQLKESISLDSLPRVILQKKGISEIEIDVKENQFYTIVNLPEDSEFIKRDFLEAEEKIKFEVDITKSAWGHSIQANLPNKNILNFLPSGEYDLYINFRTRKSESNNKDILNFSSNILDVSYE